MTIPIVIPDRPCKLTECMILPECRVMFYDAADCRFMCVIRFVSGSIKWYRITA